MSEAQPKDVAHAPIDLRLAPRQSALCTDADLRRLVLDLLVVERCADTARAFVAAWPAEDREGEGGDGASGTGEDDVAMSGVEGAGGIDSPELPAAVVRQMIARRGASLERLVRLTAQISAHTFSPDEYSRPSTSATRTFPPCSQRRPRRRPVGRSCGPWRRPNRGRRRPDDHPARHLRRPHCSASICRSRASSSACGSHRRRRLERRRCPRR